MKKGLLLILLLSFTARAVCQDTTQLKHTKEYYLEKSKRQRKTGWILLGTGAVAVTAGILLVENGIAILTTVLRALASFLQLAEAPRLFLGLLMC